MASPTPLVVTLLVTLSLVPLASAGADVCVPDAGILTAYSCQVEEDPTDVEAFGDLTVEWAGRSAEQSQAFVAASLGATHASYEVFCGTGPETGCPAKQHLLVESTLWMVDYTDEVSMRGYCNAGAGRLSLGVCLLQTGMVIGEVTLDGVDHLVAMCGPVIGQICPDIPSAPRPPQEIPLCRGEGNAVDDTRCATVALAADADATSRNRILSLADSQAPVTDFAQRLPPAAGAIAMRELARQGTVADLLLTGATPGHIAAAECNALIGESSCERVLP